MNERTMDEEPPMGIRAKDWLHRVVRSGNLVGWVAAVDEFTSELEIQVRAGVTVEGAARSWQLVDHPPVASDIEALAAARRLLERGVWAIEAPDRVSALLVRRQMLAGDLAPSPSGDDDQGAPGFLADPPSPGGRAGERTSNERRTLSDVAHERAAANPPPLDPDQVCLRPGCGVPRASHHSLPHLFVDYVVPDPAAGRRTDLVDPDDWMDFDLEPRMLTRAEQEFLMGLRAKGKVPIHTGLAIDHLLQALLFERHGREPMKCVGCGLEHGDAFPREPTVQPRCADCTVKHARDLHPLDCQSCGVPAHEHSGADHCFILDGEALVRYLGLSWAMSASAGYSIDAAERPDMAALTAELCDALLALEQDVHEYRRSVEVCSHQILQAQDTHTLATKRAERQVYEGGHGLLRSRAQALRGVLVAHGLIGEGDQ